MALATPMTNLPAYMPPLIGRQSALAELESLLARTRLLTLTGTGGSGKTRLALQVAIGVRRCYPAGVWLVELAPLWEPALLSDVVLAALGVPETSDLLPSDRLLAFLQDRELLLVLDNCEHLLPGCVQLIETLLHACPRVRVLATSREILNSPYERVWPVPPLTLPDRQPSLAPDRAMTSEAIQLFVDRASAVVPTFTLAASNVAAVAAICQCLDGIPLAIELAASCISMLAPEQIAAQLATGFHLLVHGQRTASPRQQTLEATLEWSYRLLTDGEQVLFRRLSVLAGSFGLDAAAAAAGDKRETMIVQLMRLIDKSLVTVVQRDGEARYRLLEVLRQYGAQQLSMAGEEEDAYARYCAWAAQLVEGAPAEPDTSTQTTWLDRIGVELDQLRAVLRWLVEHSQIDGALRLATSLVGFWRQRGHVCEGSRWLEIGSAAECTEVPPLVRARALNALGVLRMWQCAYDQAQALHQEALTLFQASGDQSGKAWTLFRLGFLADRCGDYQAATAHLEQSRRLFVELGDSWGIDVARNRLGSVALNQGDYEQATTYLEGSLRFQRANRHAGGIASTLLNLGLLALEQGDLSRATQRLEESLTLNRNLKDCLPVAYALTYLGYAALLRRDLEQAQLMFREALAALDPQSNPEIVFRLFDGMAVAAARQGAVARAARLWGAGEGIRASYRLQYRPIEQQHYERELSAIRCNVDQERFAAVWEEGRRLPLAAIFTEAASSAPLPADRRGAPTLIGGAALAEDEQRFALRIYGLGGVKIYRGERLLTARDLTYTKATELLLYLLRHPSRTRDQIGLALWPDASPESLRTTFRVVIYHLRRALGPANWIVREHQHYALNRSLTYWYDVEAFHSAVAEAKHRPEAALAPLETARSLYQGDFGEGLTACEWIVQEQEALRRTYMDVLLALGQLYCSRGELRRALETFLQAIGCDRYCEEAHRGAMTCYLQLHEPSQAAHHYERLRQLLHQELGILPAPETRALLQSQASEIAGHLALAPKAGTQSGGS